MLFSAVCNKQTGKNINQSIFQISRLVESGVETFFWRIFEKLFLHRRKTE